MLEYEIDIKKKTLIQTMNLRCCLHIGHYNLIVRVIILIYRFFDGGLCMYGTGSYMGCLRILVSLQA